MSEPTPYPTAEICYSPKPTYPIDTLRDNIEEIPPYEFSEDTPTSESNQQNTTETETEKSTENIPNTKERELTTPIREIPKPRLLSMYMKIKNYASMFYRKLKNQLRKKYNVDEDTLKTNYPLFNFINEFTKRLLGILCFYGEQKQGKYVEETKEEGKNKKEKTTMRKILRGRRTHCVKYQQQITQLTQEFFKDHLYKEDTVDIFSKSRNYLQAFDILFSGLQFRIQNDKPLLTTLNHLIVKCKEEVKLDDQANFEKLQVYLNKKRKEHGYNVEELRRKFRNQDNRN